jgi:serine/tyrosine/threonine adenylyltransferase
MRTRSPFTHLSLLPWVNHFVQLGDSFYSRVNPSPLTSPHWVHINHAVANYIGISADALLTAENLAIFSGAEKINQQQPIAMVYAGHQFGGYSPQLGDGRGLLIGQLHVDADIIDLHLKGAGKTPYSRFGDGRAVLRSSIREYLAGEAMHHLGIPSSRALCITASDDPVHRETIETAAMVTRVAKTHIRFGHFEYFHYQQQFEQVRQLADHVIAQFLPEATSHPKPYQQLLLFCVKHTARMIAKWQSVGFAHGVMNTDNMSIIGETLDYGPYGFLDDYEPNFICNHSDHQGRYAFDQQPSIGLWNLHALAHSLSSLISKEEIMEALDQYEPILVNHYAELMRQKFGWQTHHKSDQSICANILHLMAQDKVDYTLFFRRLCDFTASGNEQSKEDNALLSELFTQKDKWLSWQLSYRQRLRAENRCEHDRQNEMKKINPKFILRNYLLQNAIEKAQNDRNYADIDRLLLLIQAPFDEHTEYDDYALPPPAWGKHLAISCSS